MPNNVADFMPAVVALITVIGARILEHYIGKRARRTKESVELKKADLERDKFIVDRAMLMVEKIEHNLEEAREEIVRLRNELVQAHITIRQLEAEIVTVKNR